MKSKGNKGGKCTCAHSAGNKDFLHRQVLDSNPELTGKITFKNLLLVQSQKWHARVQSHERA